LTALAEASVGFDKTRGDAVTVEDLPFEENGSARAASMPGQILSAAENSPVLVKYIALLAGLLVVLSFGVRPALKGARAALSAGPPPQEMAAAQHAAHLPAEPAQLDPERMRTQEIFEQVTGHVKREPTQTSRLLQSWIHSE